MSKKSVFPKGVRIWLYVLGALGVGGYLRGRKADKEQGTILILGDSQSQTYDAKLRPTPKTASYTLGTKIADHLKTKGHDARTIGIAGRGVRSYLGAKKGSLSLDEIFDKYKPQTLIVELGGNDAMFLTKKGGSMSEKFYKAKLVQFVKKAQDAGIKKIIWLGPSYVDDAAYNQLRLKIARWQSEVLPALGVAWADQQENTKGLTRNDGLHHGAAGYAAWAAKLGPQLVKEV